MSNATVDDIRTPSGGTLIEETPARALRVRMVGTDGNAATVADGSDVALGATTDAAVTSPASSGSVIALLKGLITLLAAGLTFTPSRGTLTNRSGAITAGTTSQTLADANTSRKYLLVENLDATEDLWINFTAAAGASQPSILIRPYGAFAMEGSFVSTEKVTVYAATTAHAFAAKEG